MRWYPTKSTLDRLKEFEIGEIVRIWCADVMGEADGEVLDYRWHKYGHIVYLVRTPFDTAWYGDVKKK